MKPLFEVNGLMFWTEEEIRIRDRMIEDFSITVSLILRRENPAWQVFRVDAPVLTPNDLINSNYGSGDVFRQVVHECEDDEIQIKEHYDRLTLRPETTAGSYVYAEYLLHHHAHEGVRSPLCVWQAGKSFRQEYDHVTKHMRLKEFYQMEFQCIYAADSMNDYHTAVLSPVQHMLYTAVGFPTRLVVSDRLPNYAEITMDVEVAFPENTQPPMELCSISRRVDFPHPLKIQGKNGFVEKPAKVVEIAIGLDRCVYARQDYLSRELKRPG